MRKYSLTLIMLIILLLLFIPAFQVAEQAPEQTVIELDNAVNLECPLETSEVLTVQVINEDAKNLNFKVLVKIETVEKDNMTIDAYMENEISVRNISEARADYSIRFS